MTLPAATTTPSPSPSRIPSDRMETRRRLATAATLVLVLVLLLISGSVLRAVNIPYASSTGPAFAKIHPATYLAVIAVLMWGWASGGLGRLIGQVAIRHPGAVMFGAGIVLLLFQTAVIVKLPLAPVIDTFLLPLLLFVCLIRLDAVNRDRLTVLAHVMVITNALLGIFEYASGWRLTPMLEADGTVIGYDWRASALFGHPLSNAFITGNYIVALAFGAAPRLHPALRIVLMGIAGMAMIAFGGRVAMVLAIAMIALATGLGAIQMLAGRRFHLNHAVLAMLLVTVGALFVVVFVESGGADRFLARFSQDHGSAQTRLSMLHIFGDLTREQFLMWPDADLIWQAQREHSIRIGVESSEVGFVANYGLLVTIAFFTTLAAFMHELVALTSRRTWWSVLYFVGVMSSSLGIASKTTVLAMYVFFTLALMPRDAET